MIIIFAYASAVVANVDIEYLTMIFCGYVGFTAWIKRVKINNNFQLMWFELWPKMHTKKSLKVLIMLLNDSY